VNSGCVNFKIASRVSKLVCGSLDIVWEDSGNLTCLNRFSKSTKTYVDKSIKFVDYLFVF